MKRTIVIISTILLNVLIALGVSFLIYGTQPIYIGDKMPPVDIGRLHVTVFMNISIIFLTLSAVFTTLALPEVIIFRRKKLLSGKGFWVTILFWIIPIATCFIKLIPQFSFTY